VKNLKWVLLVPVRLLGLATTLILFILFRPIAKYLPIGLSSVLLLVYSWSIGTPIDNFVEE
jgi:hypothetical protein